MQLCSKWVNRPATSATTETHLYGYPFCSSVSMAGVRVNQLFEIQMQQAPDNTHQAHTDRISSCSPASMAGVRVDLSPSQVQQAADSPVSQADLASILFRQLWHVAVLAAAKARRTTKGSMHTWAVSQSQNGKRNSAKCQRWQVSNQCTWTGSPHAPQPTWQAWGSCSAHPAGSS